MNYHVEYGGGLGDVVMAMHFNGSYNFLGALHPTDTASIAVTSHCPGVADIFKYHPLAKQFTVTDYGYWDHEDDEAKRKEFGLPPHDRILTCPNFIRAMKWYPHPSDQREHINLFSHASPKRVILCAFGAGLPERNVPQEMADYITKSLFENGYLPVIVGKSYDRHGRFEPRVADFCWNLIDKLTVPGIAELVNRVAGVVCAHSAVNAMAWIRRKPQLLLYPDSVEQTHFARRDRWAFGAHYPETIRCTFANFCSTDIRVFLDVAEGKQRLQPAATLPLTENV